MIGWLFDLIFGCMHENYSWPQGKHRRHVTCLECGREFEYDWDEMKIVSPREQRRRAKEAVECQ